MELVWFTCYSESQIWFIYQVQCVHNLLHIVSNYLTIKKNIYDYLVCKVWWNFIWLHGVISPRIKLTLIKEFNSCVKRMFHICKNAPLAQHDGTSMAMLNTFLYRILQMEIKATVCARKAQWFIFKTILLEKCGVKSLLHLQKHVQIFTGWANYGKIWEAVWRYWCQDICKLKFWIHV